MILIGQRRASGLCRLPLQSLLTSNAQRQTAIRTSSLSAIHRGVRQSEKVRFEDAFATRRGTYPEKRRERLTSKAVEGISSPRQLGKLRKKLGRKAEEDNDEESTRQTRRKRFLDPEKSFGKRSLVYQLKHGALKDTADSLDLQEPVRPRPFRSSRSEQPSRSDRARGSERAYRSERFDRSERLDNSERSHRSERSTRTGSFHGSERPSRLERSRPERSRPERSFGSRQAPRSERKPHSNGAEEIRDQNGEDDTTPRGRKKPMMPMAIKYTTAASQFLYGKSVVKAALEQERRKLYHLYIYAGENRKDSKDNFIIARMAERRGVPVTMVPNGEQRLMDRMSMGRPHNGFVLETSPLPQLPVTALGKLEESPGRLGFHIELGHQSKEQEAINGGDTFIPRKSDITPKPFVLLLNEIVDPGNLGGLLRTASYLGIDAVGITNKSSSITPVVLKSAAGAVEEVTIFTIDSPVEFIEQSKKAGWKTYAAVAPPEPKFAKLHEDKFISIEVIERTNPLSSSPCILVLGSEGFGLSKPIKVAADYELSVPRFVQNSCVDSLNVSVAGGLLCHAFVKSSDSSKPAVTAPQETTEAEVDYEYVEIKSEDDVF